MRCSLNRASGTKLNCSTVIRLLVVFLTSKAFSTSPSNGFGTVAVIAFTLGPGLPATITPTRRSIERCTAIKNSKDDDPPPAISNDGNEENWPTAPGYFSRVARTVSSLINMKDSVSPGDVIFAKGDVSASSICADQGYDVASIYHQGLDKTIENIRFFLCLRERNICRLPLSQIQRNDSTHRNTSTTSASPCRLQCSQPMRNIFRS